MSELKTKATDKSVIDFINTIEHPQKKADSKVILEMMQRITQCKPVLWGDSIIGFDTYHFKYASGREGDWMVTGFSPRKQNISLYLMCEVAKQNELLAKLGKHKTGASCLYINKLEDVNLKVLEELIENAYRYMKEKYPNS